MRLKNSTKNSVIGIITLLILSVAGLIVTKILIGTLGAEFNGLNGLFTDIISILSITELGLSTAISFNLYKPIIDNDTEKIKSIMLFFRKCYHIIGSLIFILSLLVTTFIPYLVKDSSLTNNYIRLIFVLFAFNSTISYFFSYKRCLFYANQKEYVNTIIDFLMKLIKHILQIVVLILYHNFVIFLIVNIIITFINNLFIYLRSIKEYPEITIKDAKEDKELEKNILNSVKSLAIVQLLNALISFTDNIIISSTINITIAGLYANYRLIINELNHIITIIYNGLGASIGNLIAEGKKEKIKEIFINLFYLSFFLGSFVATSIYIIMEPFVKIWLGSKYLLPNICLFLMAINFYLIIIRQPMIYYLKNSGNFKSLVLPYTIEAILNVLGSLILSFIFKLPGILLMTFISSIISTIIITYQIAKHFELNFKNLLEKHLKFILIVIINFIILRLFFKYIIISNKYLNLLVAGLLCLVIPNIISLIILIKNKSLDYLRSILSKVLRKKVNYV